ncbi:DNA-binding transcriptional LysR family regulator [Clostridium saccharoperbutylacetonicum]|uniref:Transcriptional regulator n=2 Tax=Clostridium saccharoperbutylacetonicum TaxID=36745 RepID=M1N3V7_9CLOT|nr:LysR family transcriptional regulator [Clostridium saccharoperbutylacetonicum]AGF58142.1 transcriptional regulator [Clostridium saccharoperbutylacetonicum N1-4(HMT)]NSB43775.1 DNA-binding transcriptional LysR family regulator [Clostridium saccharoperbutylacetonicum]
MYINKLVYFISVAENLNFTKAAQECHLAQPAISQQINSLEHEIGFQLFIRTSKNVVLTEAGKVFYEEVKKIIEGYKTAVKKAESVAYGFEGMITIGICGGTEEVFLPQILKVFKEMYPLIGFEFRRAAFNDISKQLENKIYDIVFTWPYDLEGLKNIGYKIIFEDEACAMMSFNNKISEKPRVSKGELAMENNIMVAYEKKTKTYKHFSEFYGKYNIKPKSIITVEDSEILNLMIDLNMGISIVPKRIKELNSNRFSFVEIQGEPHSIKFCVAYLKENTNPCVELFVNNAAIR